MSRKRLSFLCLVVVVALAVSLALPGCGGGEEAKRVIIWGNQGPFSGPYAAWGLMLEPGLEIAAEDINAEGGIKVGDDNYMVEVREYDNAFNPSISATVGRKAIFDDGCKFLQVQSTDESAAINELCNLNNTFLFAYATDLSIFGSEYPYTYQIYIWTSEVERVMLDFIEEKYPDSKRVAVFAPDDTRGHNTAEAFADLATDKGFTLVDVLYTGAEEVEFTSALSALLNKGVDFINLSVSGPEVQGNVIKQARELGFKGFFLHPDTLDTNAVVGITGSVESLEGNMGGSQWLDMPTAVGKSYQERFVDRYGSMQAWTGSGYDTMMLVKLAIEKAQSLDPEEIRKALPEVSYEGTMGFAAFRGAELPEVGNDCVLTIPINVVQIQNGKEVSIGVGEPWWEE